MKRKIFTFAAALALTICSILPVSAAGTGRTDAAPVSYVCSQCPDASVSSSAMSRLERTAADLVNAERRARGLAPLTVSSDLSAKARIKSADMNQNRYFSHNSPTYGSPFAMMKSLGISYRSAGENIAMHYRTADAVVRAWMASPSHRANILSTNYTTMGIGYVNGYWTQWFIR